MIAPGSSDSYLANSLFLLPEPNFASMVRRLFVDGSISGATLTPSVVTNTGCGMTSDCAAR